MAQRTYASPLAFKQALEQRLRATTPNGVAFSRKRQILVFERFLARVSDAFGEAVTLKGGLVLELRLDRVRTTKDVDLKMFGSPEDVFDRLQDAMHREMGELPYAAMVREDRLTWPTLEDLTYAVQAFLDPVLSGRFDAVWSPETWGWDQR